MLHMQELHACTALVPAALKPLLAGARLAMAAAAAADRSPLSCRDSDSIRAKVAVWWLDGTMGCGNRNSQESTHPCS
jgi:hypothetical protein